MAAKNTKDLEKVEKKEVEKTEEMTWAGVTYAPDVDIWETDGAITLAADMPGVRKEDIDIDLHNGVLTVHGRLTLNQYEGMRALYSEYNVGNYYRRFTLGEKIDQENIGAKMDDGVLTVTLPKRPQAVPRKLTVK